MNKLKRLIISSAALLLFSGLALAAPVAAQDGTDSNTNPTSDSSGTGMDDQANSLAEQFREKAKEKVQQAKDDHQQQTEAQREKVCNIRQGNLARKMSRMVTVANQHKANIDRIYTKVKDFYTTKQLNVSNYADLTAKVDTAQTAAADGISALSSLDTSIDCTSQTVANNVASFREAVTSTRDALKAYRSALVDLITALKGASTSTNGTDNTDTNSQ